MNNGRSLAFRRLSYGVVVTESLEQQLGTLSPGLADRVRRELVRIAGDSAMPGAATPRWPRSLEVAGVLLRCSADEQTGTLIAESVAPVQKTSAHLAVRLRILLVDDDRFALTLLGDRLLQLGHEVVSVETAQAALEERLDGYDAIVCDFVMPGMNGAELLRRVREERRSSIPFTFVTGSRQPEELVHEAIRLDADFLPKPVNVAQLLDLLLDRRRDPRSQCR